MNLRYRVTLSQEERAQLRDLVSGGKGRVRRLKRAQILLAADAGATDESIAVNVAVGTSTVYRTKRRFVEDGLEEALSEEPRPGAERKLSAGEEALLVATACAKPPAGRAKWTPELLADAMVRLTHHASISSETIRRRLAEKELKPWQRKMWCIPKLDQAQDVPPGQRSSARSGMAKAAGSQRKTVPEAVRCSRFEAATLGQREVARRRHGFAAGEQARTHNPACRHGPRVWILAC